MVLFLDFIDLGDIPGVRPLCLGRQPETGLLAGLVEFTVECGFFVGDDHSRLPFGLTYRHLYVWRADRIDDCLLNVIETILAEHS
jgi:hypothetical protein